MERTEDDEMARAIAASLHMVQVEKFNSVALERGIQDSLNEAPPNESSTACNIKVPKDFETLLADNNGVHMNYLRRNLGVNLKSVKTFTTPELHITSNKAAATQVAKQYILDIFHNKEAFLLELEKKNEVHIFVDNNNIILGSQVTPGQQQMDKAIRVDINRLTELVEGSRNVTQRVTFGSFPQTQEFWDRWERRGYKAHVQKQSGPESFVDDALIAQIQDQILQFPNSGRTLVLLTGDGNSNHGRVTFAETASRALDYGWRVEVWCWRQTANPVYNDFQCSYYGSIGRFKLFYLDDFRSDITFTVTASNAIRREPTGHGAAWAVTRGFGGGAAGPSARRGME